MTSHLIQNGITLYSGDGSTISPIITNHVISSLLHPEFEPAYNDWISKVADKNNLSEIMAALNKVAGSIEKSTMFVNKFMDCLPKEIGNDESTFNKWLEKEAPDLNYDFKYHLRYLIKSAKTDQEDLALITQFIEKVTQDQGRIQELSARFAGYDITLICITGGSYVTDFIMVSTFMVSNRIFAYGNTVKQALATTETKNTARGGAATKEDCFNTILKCSKKFSQSNQNRTWMKTKELVMTEVMNQFNANPNAYVVLDTNLNSYRLHRTTREDERDRLIRGGRTPTDFITRADIPVASDDRVCLTGKLTYTVPANWYNIKTKSGVI